MQQFKTAIVEALRVARAPRDVISEIDHCTYVIDVLQLLFDNNIVGMPPLTGGSYINSPRMQWFGELVISGRRIKVPYRNYGIFEFDNSPQNPYGMMVMSSRLVHVPTTVRFPIPDYADGVHYFNQLAAISKYVFYSGPPPLYTAKPDVPLESIKSQEKMIGPYGELDNGSEYIMSRDGLLFKDIPNIETLNEIVRLLKSVQIPIMTNNIDEIVQVFDTRFMVTTACDFNLSAVKVAFLSDPMNYGKFIYTNPVMQNYIFYYNDEFIGQQKVHVIRRTVASADMRFVSKIQLSKQMSPSESDPSKLEPMPEQYIYTYNINVSTIFPTRARTVTRLMCFIRYLAFTNNRLNELIYGNYRYLSTARGYINRIMTDMQAVPGVKNEPRLTINGKVVGRPQGCKNTRREVVMSNYTLDPNIDLFMFTAARGFSVGTHVIPRSLYSIFPELNTAEPTNEDYYLATPECINLSLQEFITTIKRREPLAPNMFYSFIESVIKKNLFIIVVNPIATDSNHGCLPEIPRYMAQHVRNLRFEESVFLHRVGDGYVLLNTTAPMSYTDKENNVTMVTGRRSDIIGDAEFTREYMECFYMPYARSIHIADLSITGPGYMRSRPRIQYVKPPTIPDEAMLQVIDQLGRPYGYVTKERKVFISKQCYAPNTKPIANFNREVNEQLRRFNVLSSILRNIFIKTGHMPCQIGPKNILPAANYRTIMLDEQRYTLNDFYINEMPVLRQDVYDKLYNFFLWEKCETERLGIPYVSRYVVGNYDVSHYAQSLEEFVYRHMYENALMSNGTWHCVPLEKANRDGLPVTRLFAFWLRSASGAIILRAPIDIDNAVDLNWCPKTQFNLLYNYPVKVVSRRKTADLGTYIVLP